MAAEGQGRLADAGSLFAQAWELRRDDYDACIAAHYVARHQASTEDTLHWNQEALARALLAGYQRVHGFFPSLYLNLGHSYEVLGDRSTASHYYDMAAEHLDQIGSSRYGDVVRHGIAEGKRRVLEHDYICSSSRHQCASRFLRNMLAGACWGRDITAWRPSQLTRAQLEERRLKARAPGHRPARLSEAEWRTLGRILDRGAVESGFDTERWTLKRIAHII